MAETRLAARFVLTAAEVNALVDPGDLLRWAQNRVEHDVRQCAEDRGLMIQRMTVIWECRVDAVAE